ncbi:MAG TPA: AAA family ATPase, partial [Vicinamibacterales bacterium]|nr:AAA family ATPase [Vicinamibacterales bacterium]
MTHSDSLSSLTSIIARGLPTSSGDATRSDIKPSLEALFADRYHARHKPQVGFRDAYGLAVDDGVAWAGMISGENPPSGPYGGASIAWFPRDTGSLITFVIGTRGLAPDEGLLTRQGHRRRTTALRRHLSELGVSVWSKPDPASLSVDVPESARRLFPACDPVFKRYGAVVYCAAWVGNDLDAAIARSAVQAFFDLYAFERGWEIRATCRSEFDSLLAPLRSAMFPVETAATVNQLLRQRRFIVLQGPPGTGKTRMAEQIRRDFFADCGRTVQFHPAVTYEDFIVGLSPDPTDTGLRFLPRRGWLLEAAEDAGSTPYILIID